MTKKEFEESELIQEAIGRGIIEIKADRVTYNLNKKNHIHGTIQKSGFEQKR